jgi:YidC/Oxa1 family membrane protein insertase
VFQTIIVQPIFNLLVLIYAIIPGHNFGLAIILFTIVVRMALWPLFRRQLHHAQAIRALQPELKRIKKESNGDRQQEARLQMELYKERQVSPFAGMAIALAQLPILLGLYASLNKIVHDPKQITEFAYPFIQNLPWIEHLKNNIHAFDNTLFGIVDLSKPALGKEGVYWWAMIIVLAGVYAQYAQSKMLLPSDKESKSLRQILKDAGRGNQADQSDVNAAVGRSTIFLIPAFVLIFTISLPAALPLYWLVGASVAILQQRRALKQDEDEMEDVAESTRPTAAQRSKRAVEAEVIETSKKSKTEQKSRHSAKASKKRRRR